MKIFLSYTTRDKRDTQLAMKLRHVLPNYGAEVFFAPEDIRAGENWEWRLHDEIGSCTHFVVILSQASVKSSWVQEEIRAAATRADDGTFVIVQITTGEVPLPFERFQCVEYRSDLENLGDQVDEIARRLGLTIPRFRSSQLRGNSRSKGSLIPKLCNREKNEREFHSIFERGLRDSPFVPQIYFLPGAKPELHSSLVDRFRCTYIADFATAAGSAEATQVGGGDVDWPLTSDVRLAVTELLTGLFATLEFAYRFDGSLPLTAEAWQNISRARAEPVFVFEHNLRSSEWREEMIRIVEGYIEFWESFAACGPQAQHVVFLNLIYDSASGVTELAALPAVILERAAERRASRGDVAAPLLVPLRELERVEREHVEDWFDLRAEECTTSDRESCCDALFASTDRVSMKFVERRLKEFYNEYSNRGFST